MAESTTRIVMPGDFLDSGSHVSQGIYHEGGKTYASVVAMTDGDRFIPLKGRYTPVYGDKVIGLVKNERFAGYDMDLNGPYEGLIGSRDTREEFDIGDAILCKGVNVEESKSAGLVEPTKLSGGELIEIEAVKVPRLLGRNGAMLLSIKLATNSDMTVGKNGRIYIKGGNSALAAMAILKVAREAHVNGLTERLEAFLKEEGAKNGAAQA